MHVFDRLTRYKELRLQHFRHVAFRENSKRKVVDLNGSNTGFQPFKRQCVLVLVLETLPCSCAYRKQGRPTANPGIDSYSSSLPRRASLIPTASSQVNRSIFPTLVAKATRNSCTTSAKVLGRIVLLTLFGLEPLGGVSCCSLVLFSCSWMIWLQLPPQVASRSPW
jgi:hypothetical protein